MSDITDRTELLEDLTGFNLNKYRFIRHPRPSDDPDAWFDSVPACAGTTKPNKYAFP